MEKITGAAKLLIDNITNFNGRANRTEFWFALLAIFIVNILAGIVLSIIMNISYTLGMIIYFVYAIAMMLSIVALYVRRLHDSNKTGWIALTLIIPLASIICLIIFGIMESDKGNNQYGAPSKNLY